MILAVKGNREVKIKATEKKAYAASGYTIIEDPKIVPTQEGKPQGETAAKKAKTTRLRAK